MFPTGLASTGKIQMNFGLVLYPLLNHFCPPYTWANILFHNIILEIQGRNEWQG